MQCDSRLKIVLEIAVSKTSKKKGPRCPYKKKLLKVKFLNSFTLLYYYIKIIKYNKCYDLLLFYLLAQKCGILFRKVGNSRSRERKSAKKVGKIQPIKLYCVFLQFTVCQNTYLKLYIQNKDKYSLFSIIQVNGTLRATPTHSVAFYNMRHSFDSPE